MSTKQNDAFLEWLFEKKIEKDKTPEFNFTENDIGWYDISSVEVDGKELTK